MTEREAHRTVFERADGVREVQLSTDPVHFRTGRGTWAEIDTAVVPDREAAGGLRSAASSWTARFGPIGPSAEATTGGMRVGTSTGTLAMAPRRHTYFIGRLLP